MKAPPLGPVAEYITFSDQKGPRRRNAPSTRKLKPENLKTVSNSDHTHYRHPGASVRTSAMTAQANTFGG